MSRITLLAKKSVASLLASMAALAIGCHTANEAAAAPPAGPSWAWNLPVYETALDLATPHGTFREFEERLDALHDLGVGIIWFLPIFPTGGNPPGKPRSDRAYCVRDYYDVNPRHGTKEDLVNLEDQPQQVTLQLGEFAGHYTEVFTAEDRVLAPQEELKLELWAYRVYLNHASQSVERSGKP